MLFSFKICQYQNGISLPHSKTPAAAAVESFIGEEARFTFVQMIFSVLTLVGFVDVPRVPTPNSRDGESWPLHFTENPCSPFSLN